MKNIALSDKVRPFTRMIFCGQRMPTAFFPTSDEKKDMKKLLARASKMAYTYFLCRLYNWGGMESSSVINIGKNRLMNSVIFSYHKSKVEIISQKQRLQGSPFLRYDLYF